MRFTKWLFVSIAALVFAPACGSAAGEDAESAEKVTATATPGAEKTDVEPLPEARHPGGFPGGGGPTGSNHHCQACDPDFSPLRYGHCAVGLVCVTPLGGLIGQPGLCRGRGERYNDPCRRF